MQYLEHGMNLIAATLKTTLEGISLLCILIGLLTTFQTVFSQNRRSRVSSSSVANMRLNFGRWLSLALEFQLGSDIVDTTIAPTFEALVKLGAIAVIRTFLNFFLTRELSAEVAISEQKRQLSAMNVEEHE